MVPNPWWEAELERWLVPFLERPGRAERRHRAPLYLRGLLLPGERKSIEPLAERSCPGDMLLKREGTTRRLQSFFVDEATLRELVLDSAQR